jgi:hypothetical protein
MKLRYIQRQLFRLLLFLIIAIFLAGTLRAYGSAGAAASATSTATAMLQTKNYATLTETPQVTPVPNPDTVAANTTGIIVFAIIIAVIVLVGASLGMGRPHKKKSI